MQISDAATAHSSSGSHGESPLTGKTPNSVQARPDSLQKSDEAASIQEPAVVRVLKSAAAVIAPTTFLTGLLYFFGWNHAYWFFYSFGMDSTVLSLSPQDYLIRSQDAIFVLLIAVAAATIAGIWFDRLLKKLESWPSQKAASRLASPVLSAVGVVLIVSVLLVAFGFISPTHPPWFPLLLAVGVVLVSYSAKLRRPRGPKNSIPPRANLSAIAEAAATCLIVGACMFWAAADWSAAVGTTRANEVVRNLSERPDATVYSLNDLGLSASGVRETRCTSPDPAYKYRYDGLKLITQAGGQMFFLPANWTNDRVAVILPKNDSTRVEYRPARTGPVSILPC